MKCRRVALVCCAAVAFWGCQPGTMRGSSMTPESGDGGVSMPPRDAALIDTGLIDTGLIDTGLQSDAAIVADGGRIEPGGSRPPGDFDYFTPATVQFVGTDCSPPPVLNLAEIPTDELLNDGDSDTLAIFEVDGDDLIGKFVRDEAAAEGGLRLWQEVVLRIPANQRVDLVQFEIFHNSGQSAIFNRTYDITTHRMGLKLGFHVENFDSNDPDVCAPLVPRRGTFDWSLIHEFGHLVGWLDGSWPRFLETFDDVRGDGEGYPEDGSPILTGDFVTSYAERADGDEDYAETFTTWVMLPASAIPPLMEAGSIQDGPLAVDKVHWVAAQPRLSALRDALRITEADGGGVEVEPAPRLFEEFVVIPPERLVGTWRGTVNEDGEPIRFEIARNDIVEVRTVGGLEQPTSIAQMHREALQRGAVLGVETSDVSNNFVLNVRTLDGVILNNDFRLEDSGDLLWSQNTIDGEDVTGTRSATLRRMQ